MSLVRQERPKTPDAIKKLRALLGVTDEFSDVSHAQNRIDQYGTSVLIPCMSRLAEKP